MPAHTLGPHLVGRRVVVRYLLPVSDGPSATDLLGTCVAFTDTEIVVAPDTGGDPVAVALAAVVTGKPVPPRAPARHRVTPAEAQRRAMTLFPGLETERLGRWTLRRSTRHDARRANSVLAFDDPDAPDAYERVVEFYTARGARPIAAVLPDSASAALFLGRGWVPESGDADTVFELASVAALARALAPTSGVSLDEAGALATASIGDLASGVAALDGDWVGYRSIAVSPGARRRGLGTAVMGELIEWSAERGATTAYLQVLGDNAPALALYAGLGFVEHHRYRYLAAPTNR